MILDFEIYQEGTGTTAIYPGAGHGTMIALSYLTHGLTSEAGEVSGKVKKILRDSDGFWNGEQRAAILDEIGDVLWYCARIVDELDGNLKSVAVRNLLKLADRRERGTLQGSGDTR